MALRSKSFSTTSGHESFRDNLLNGTESFEALEPTNLLTSDFATGYSTVSDTLARIYLETPVWPLQDRHEAKLMRHFIENLAASSMPDIVECNFCCFCKAS